MSQVNSRSERRSGIRADRGGACSPVASVFLLGLVVALAGTVMTAVFCVAPELTEPPPSVCLSASASGDRIELVHRGGDQIDVQKVTVFVQIDGEPLTQQPPVPFFAAEGFQSAPTGPFNSASEHTWRPGECASFRVATTNDPYPTSGDSVEIRISIRGQPIAKTDTRVK